MLANMFPMIKNPKDETDKITSCIHIYCSAGADKIEELQNKVEELQSIIDELNNK